MSLFPYGIFWYLTPWRSGESSGLCPGASDQWIGHTPYTTKVRAPCPHFPLCSFFFGQLAAVKCCNRKKLQIPTSPGMRRRMLLTSWGCRILVQHWSLLGEILCGAFEILFDNTGFGVRKTGFFSYIYWSVTQEKLLEVLEIQCLISKIWN